MSYNNNYKKQRISTFVLFFMAGLFFVSLIYEVTSDGVTAIFEWLPAIEWANFAGDTVVNVLQILIFSLVAGAAGSRYNHSGRNDMGQYRKNNNFQRNNKFQPNNDRKQISQKPKYGNYGRKLQ